MRAQDARLIFYFHPVDSDKNLCDGHGKSECEGDVGHEALMRA